MARPFIKESEEKNICYIFLILDPKGSIMNLKSTRSYVGQDGSLQIDITHYLDKFPFKYYIIVRVNSNFLIKRMEKNYVN